MLFEVFAPLLLLLGRPGVTAFVMMAVAFHIGIALIMGLTTFVFAFFAALPVLYYCVT
jgi:hypothetical protein